MTPHILLLIALLGHERFAIRQEAETQLRELCPAAITQLESFCTCKDVEIAHRARRIVDWYYAPAPTCGGPLPWIDSQPPEKGKQALVEKWLSRVRPDGSAWCGYPGWPDYRDATALWVRHLMRAEGWDRGRAIRLLDEMVIHERAICERNGWPVVGK